MEKGYEKILERLSKVSGVEKEEINRRVEAKRAKLSGLISYEGALQVIAAELGISFDNEKLKIDELLPGMRKVNFSGKVIAIHPIRTFTTKSGDEGKVANMIIADETSNIKVVLWDVNHIDLLESGEIQEGTCVDVVAGNMRGGEVHMGSFAELKVSDQTFDEVQTEKPVKNKEVVEFNVGDKVVSRSFVVQAFSPRFYDANPETGKKITEEELASGVPSEKRAILNVVIDDGTENIRAVLFHEMVQKLGITELKDENLIEQQRQNILGKEMIFEGNVRMNSYFNNPELIVDSIEEVDLDKEIAALE